MAGLSVGVVEFFVDSVVSLLVILEKVVLGSSVKEVVPLVISAVTF